MVPISTYAGMAASIVKEVENKSGASAVTVSLSSAQWAFA
jgi:hypothetical protein